MTKWIPYPFFHDDVPVDISFVFEAEKPAGKHGFLKTEGRQFVFEDGTPVKFWGTNFNGWGCFPEKDYAEKLAKRLAKIGLNLVRFHQLDSEWHTPNIFAFTKGKRVTGGHLDPESMDRLDYLIYCLKKEGIYCYMDMFTYRRFKSDENVDNAENLLDAAKPYCVYNPRLIELQKELCTELWQHKNPYTELRYCDDPVFVLAEIVNESDLFTKSHPLLTEPYKTELANLFDAWLQKNGKDKKAADVDFSDYEDEDFIDFKTELQEEYYRTMLAHMREVGVKIPITGTNWISSPANMKTQLLTDFYDDHTYYYDWRWGEFEKHGQNLGITERDYSLLSHSAFATAKDKPTYISEWDMPWPNAYRAESPLFCAAVGLLQGWSGFAIHTYSYSARLENMNMLGKEIYAEKIGGIPYRQGIFSAWNDPAKFGLFQHAALMTRRGDVQEAKNTVEIRPISKHMHDWTAAHENVEVSRVIANYDFKEFAEDRAWPAGRTESLSDTGELYRSWGKNYGYINTPKTKCAYGFLLKNGKQDLSGVSIDCHTDFATIAMSSLTDADITKSDNILLTAVGRAENTDAKFEGDLMLDIGKPPVLIEVIEADITIDTDVEGLKVWAVSPEGFYIGTIPTKHENGKLSFTIGKESQSMYYLIVKE